MQRIIEREIRSCVCVANKHWSKFIINLLSTSFVRQHWVVLIQQIVEISVLVSLL